jgi:hypothetical protein
MSLQGNTAFTGMSAAIDQHNHTQDKAGEGESALAGKDHGVTEGLAALPAMVDIQTGRKRAVSQTGKQPASSREISMMDGDQMKALGLLTAARNSSPRAAAIGCEQTLVMQIGNRQHTVASLQGDFQRQSQFGITIM